MGDGLGDQHNIAIHLHRLPQPRQYCRAAILHCNLQVTLLAYNSTGSSIREAVGISCGAAKALWHTKA